MNDDIRPGNSPDLGQVPSKNQENQPKEPVFETPEVVSQKDNLLSDDSGSIGISKSFKQKVKHSFREKGLKLWPATKRQKIIGSGIIAALIVFGSVGVFALSRYLNQSPQFDNVILLAEKETEPSKLTGVEVKKSLNERPVVGVMIENSPDARPQSGLKNAGVVFEAIAEGGITRFLALYQEDQPDYIGPVRSVRPYYIDFLLPFEGALAHAGGSAEGLAKLKRLKVKDIDHGANPSTFRRVNDRFAPHNLYTSMGELDKAQKSRGYTKSNFARLERKPERPAPTPTAKTIDFSISSFLYNPQFVYDQKNNNYKRNLAGKPHNDQKARGQITPKVVVALVMNHSYGGIYSVYKTSGSGTVFVFQDGKVQKGKWTKKDSKGQFRFTDADGKKLALNPGQTWFSLVSSESAVKYKP